MQPRLKPGAFFRQCVGIDVAKETFTACLSMLDDEGCNTPSFEFYNNKTGFNQLVRWARKEALKEYPLCFVMEPTGVYYEELASHLLKLGYTVHVIPAKRVKSFAESEGYKTKTDKVDAYILSMLGCQKRNLKPWKAPDPVMAEIRSLCRLRSDMVKIRTMLKNQIEAMEHSRFRSDKSLKISKTALVAIEKNISMAEKEISGQTAKCDNFKELLPYAVSVPGIGEITATAILAETACFRDFASQRQLVSFAGLDVVARQSGPHDPRRHISKKGNTAIRAMLYICAMSAITHYEEIRTFYNRIKTSNPNGKVAMVAVMRKLLVLLYTVCKNKTTYDINFEKDKEEKENNDK